jgi:hypothetical protein
MRPLGEGIHIEPDTSASQALRRMEETDSSRLLVMEGEELRGLISRGGITRFAQMKETLDGEDKQGSTA